jgi:hypothetical protein
MSGKLVSFTPQEVRGIGTPVITEHLKPGAITYNANGGLNQIGGYMNFGRGGKHSRYTKRNIRRLKRTQKINRHRRTKTYSAGGKKKGRKSKKKVRKY